MLRRAASSAAAGTARGKRDHIPSYVSVATRVKENTVSIRVKFRLELDKAPEYDEPRAIAAPERPSSPAPFSQRTQPQAAVPPFDQSQLQISLLKWASVWTARRAKAADFLDTSTESEVESRGARAASPENVRARASKRPEARPVLTIRDNRAAGGLFPGGFTCCTRVDEATLATGSEHGRVSLWDLPSGRKLGTLHSHARSVQSLAVLPGRGLLAIGHADGLHRLVDLSDRTVFRSFAASHVGLPSMLAPPGGRHLISGLWTGEIVVWSVDSRLEPVPRSVGDASLTHGGREASDRAPEASRRGTKAAPKTADDGLEAAKTALSRRAFKEFVDELGSADPANQPEAAEGGASSLNKSLAALGFKPDDGSLDAPYPEIPAVKPIGNSLDSPSQQRQSPESDGSLLAAASAAPSAALLSDFVASKAEACPVSEPPSHHAENHADAAPDALAASDLSNGSDGLLSSELASLPAGDDPLASQLPAGDGSSSREGNTEQSELLPASDGSSWLMGSTEWRAAASEVTASAASSSAVQFTAAESPLEPADRAPEPLWMESPEILMRVRNPKFKRLKGHWRSVQCLALLDRTRTASFLASGSGDGTIRVWTLGGHLLQTLGPFGSEVLPFTSPSAAAAAAVATASGASEAVRIRASAHGNERLSSPTHSYSQPGGLTPLPSAASAAHDSARLLLQLPLFQSSWRPGFASSGTEAPSADAAASDGPDGGGLDSADASDAHAIEQYPLRSRMPRRVASAGAPVYDIHVGSDGSVFSAHGDGVIRRWNVNRGLASFAPANAIDMSRAAVAARAGLPSAEAESTWRSSVAGDAGRMRDHSAEWAARTGQWKSESAAHSSRGKLALQQRVLKLVGSVRTRGRPWRVVQLPWSPGYIAVCYMGEASIDIIECSRSRVVQTLRAHRRSVLGLMALQDGRLLSWGKDGNLHVWSAEDLWVPITTLPRSVQ